MNFIINKTTLETISNQVQNFLEKKDLSQITSHILLEVINDKLIIMATDYEIGIKLETNNIIIKENGKATINGKKLLEIVKNFKNEDISIEKKEDEIIIKQNRIKFKLPSMIAEEFPIFPNKENKKVLEIKDDDISEIFKIVNQSIDNNNVKYELNGMLLKAEEENIHFISTDTKRLTVSLIKQINNQEIHNIIIPKKAVYEIIKLFSKEINIIFDNKTFIIEKNNIFFYSKLINGTYPDVDKIIPSNFNYEINLVKEDIINAINIINTVSDKVKIEFKNNLITFENIENLNIEAKTQLDLENNFDISLRLNGKYILDFLYTIKEDIFTMKIVDSKSAILLESKNNKVVIMVIKEYK
jgi:DNA polymerase-3 subunit beta